LREAAGLTQEELAEKAGLTSYAVSALERGRRRRPYPHTVRSLVQALGASDEDRALLLDAIPRRGVSAPTAEPAAEGNSLRSAPIAVPPVTDTAGLPVPATTLHGRHEETAALGNLLLRQERRLVTLTGTGGVGKTRLATAVATQVASAFPDGVAMVSLAPLADSAMVLPAVARAVGSAALEGPDATQLLVEHLRPLRFLLVLDNLEHLLEAAEQVAALVADCPRLVVLVTSRAPLRVRGETEFPVLPLAVPIESAADPADLQEYAAVAVFTDRAQAVSPGFHLTKANAPAVSALCRHLAGIPLALELAAARVRFLDPQALLARLDDAMARSGGPDLPARQRTMRATFDWSYELLPQPEQRLLRVLSVFHGGCSLDAVEDVSARVGIDGPVLSLLEVLVEHSLVFATTDPEGQPRFGLLEPIAQYARSRATDEEAAQLHSAHAASFLRFAEQAAPEYQAADQVRWLDRAEREDANLTAAIAWSLQSGDGETAGRLGWALWLFWWLRGRLVVGARLMEEALRHEMPPVVRARAHLAGASMAFALGDLETAGTRWREGELLAYQGEDELAKAGATAGVGLVALAQGDLAGAEDHFLRALPHAEGQGRYGDWLQSLIRTWLGTVHMLRGEVNAAVAAMRQGLESARGRGDRLTAYVALFNLSQAAIAQGDHEVAREHLHEGIRLSRETGDLANLAYFLETLSVVEAATGSPERVAVLIGAAETVREAAGAGVYGYYKPDEALRQQSAAAARAALGNDDYDDAVDVGRSLTPRDAISYALDEMESPRVA
jgi:predicted ATPase/transcriptional regulator with XRE-family HTH domain